MSRSTQHTRIPHFPIAETLRYARLDSLHEESARNGTSLILDYHELVLDSAPQLVMNDGAPAEYLQGQYVPQRIRFSGIMWRKRTELYTDLDSLPLGHPARHLQGMLHWYPPAQAKPLYMLLNSSTEPEGLILTARHCSVEARSGPAIPVTRIQQWSSPPPIRPSLVPHAKQLLNRYGGDPISIHLGRRVYHRRLFVGGIALQPKNRPKVDVVLNLSEMPSRWSPVGNMPPDRWSVKGEDTRGMGVEELVNEGQWVIERIQCGKRVLVHCTAGINRSVTVCCAALIQLEKLTAEAALQRIQTHHPWARPDAQHWLALRWLAHRQHPSDGS